MCGGGGGGLRLLCCLLCGACFAVRSGNETPEWLGRQWQWRLHVHHFWRPSTSENNFLSPNLAEPIADARLCCARALAHRHVAPRRPRSGLFTWQRLRCPKGPCIGKRGEGRWWVRPPANSRTSFSEGQKDYRTIGTGALEPFEPVHGGASGGPKEPVPIISVLELTSLGPLLPGANSSSLRRKRARRAARRQKRLTDLPRRGPPLREVSAVGRVVTVDRHDGERKRLTKNSARYEHVLARDLWVSIEAALPHEHLPRSESASKQLFQQDSSLLDTDSPTVWLSNQRLGTLLCSLFDDTPPPGPARSRFVLRVRPPGRRVDRPQGRGAR